jgi:hypothetical protein
VKQRGIALLILLATATAFLLTAVGLYAQTTASVAEQLPVHPDIFKWLLNGVWTLISLLFLWAWKELKGLMNEIKTELKTLTGGYHDNRERILKLETEHKHNHRDMD